MTTKLHPGGGRTEVALHTVGNVEAKAREHNVGSLSEFTTLCLTVDHIGLSGDPAAFELQLFFLPKDAALAHNIEQAIREAGSKAEPPAPDIGDAGIERAARTIAAHEAHRLWREPIDEAAFDVLKPREKEKLRGYARAVIAAALNEPDKEAP